MASPPASETGSLIHGVSRNSWLLSTHVQLLPDSETTVPMRGFARQLTHGAGVAMPGSRRITYSLPSAVKPPRPLKAWSGHGAGSGSGAVAVEAGVSESASRRRGLSVGMAISGRLRLSVCSTSVPPSSVSITRATACRRTRSSSESCSPRRTKMPPARSMRPASGLAETRAMIDSCRTCR